jgi:hypothetical protein
MPKWTKGQSGNPYGRPPKDRMLSSILAAKANDQTGEVTNKDLVAARLWQFATSGHVELDGQTLKADSVTEWLNAVRWIYNHIDGPAPVHEPQEEIVVRVERTPYPETD